MLLVKYGQDRSSARALPGAGASVRVAAAIRITILLAKPGSLGCRQRRAKRAIKGTAGPYRRRGLHRGPSSAPVMRRWGTRRNRGCRVAASGRWRSQRLPHRRRADPTARIRRNILPPPSIRTTTPPRAAAGPLTLPSASAPSSPPRCVPSSPRSAASTSGSSTARIGTASAAYAASASGSAYPGLAAGAARLANRHAHRGGRAAAAPGPRHAGAAQHHRAGKHQLAGQVAPPRPPSAASERAMRSARTTPAAHLQVGHEPPVGMHHQPLIQRATHRRRLYAHHSRSDSPPMIRRRERNDPLCSTASAPSIMAVNPCIVLPASSLSHACRGSICGCA